MPKGSSKVRISGMDEVDREALIRFLSDYLKVRFHLPERHLKGVRSALQALDSRKEWISLSQYQAILILLRTKYNRASAEGFKRFVEENNKLNVFLELGD